MSLLFEPGKIGTLEVKNRLVMAPVSVGGGDADNYITDDAVEFFAVRARGGVGLIVTGSLAILPEARAPSGIGLYDDRFIPRLRQFTDAMHRGGARVACQLGYLGPMAPSVWQGRQLPADIKALGPSPVPLVPLSITPVEMTKEDIRRVIEGWAEAARRARDAGFDAVEVHSAHGHFLAAFLSPFKNRRTDEYGGTLENRARLTCEAISRVRERTGPDFPVLVRYNGDDFFRGGTTLDDAVRLAPLFIAAGVDGLDISTGALEAWEWKNLNYMHPDGAIVHLAETVKKASTVPVITVGKIGDPVFAEGILREGKADFIAMARALLADPELPNKAREGRLDDIRRCLYCNNCRHQWEQLGKWRLGCTVNPSLLQERESAVNPSPRTKKVIVAGGGLAGMEAARVLAERGHRVTLYERTARLGGQWNVACLLPEKGNFARLTQDLSRGLEAARVPVIYNTEVTRHLVEQERPDAVVVATGAVPAASDAPGSEGKNVLQALDVFVGRAAVGRKVVVIGGRERGMEVAALLAGQGKQVSLATRSQLGRGVDASIYVTLRDRLIGQGVAVFPYAPVYAFREDGVYLVDSGQKQLLFLEADTIVLAVGSVPQNRLLQELKGVVGELHGIGDCVKPRNARAATGEGAEIGRRI